jgi:hypothetical protein
MKQFVTTTAACCFVAFVWMTAAGEENHQEQPMKIFHHGSQASQTGPAGYFTGSVRIDPMVETEKGKSAEWIEQVSDEQYIAHAFIT